MRLAPSLMLSCAVLLAPLLAAHAAGQPAAPTWQQLRERGVLRVGLPGDYAPYALESADGPMGVDVVLAREVAATLGLGVEFVHTSWGSLMDEARAGRFDIAAGGISITPERKREQRFTRAYFTDHKAPLVRCGEEARLDTLGEINLPAVRVIVNPGGTNERFARREFPLASLTVHPDNRTVASELLALHADVFVTDAVEGRLLSAGHAGLCVAEDAPDWEPASKGMLVAADEGVRRHIDGALGQALQRRDAASRLAEWRHYGWYAGAGPAQELARLADLRLDVVTEVARWKWNRQAPIEDLPREASLLAAQRAAGSLLGLPQTQVDAFFAAQIDAAKQLQRDLFELWRRQGAREFSGVADLDGRLRPAIDAINTRMVQAMARWDGRPVEERELAPFGTGQLSSGARQLAQAPLLRGAGTRAAGVVGR